MKVTQIDAYTWDADGHEVWYHTVKKVFFCWDCRRWDCAHVQAVQASAAPSAQAQRGGEAG
jgi:hypothetical protein